jgi:hypothetical protein
MNASRRLVLAAAAVALAGATFAEQAPKPGQIPADHRTLQRATSYAEMAAFLKTVEKPGLIAVSEATKTVQGRSVFLVHLNRGGERARFRILFYAQQHGDEHAGKEALLYLIRDIAASPERLPLDVDLWVMPMLNPDGAEANKRRNGDDADLNRDHMLLLQPEVLALYKVCQRVMPHVAVDCHEFSRDSKGYTAKGWLQWPIITMDTTNNPLCDPATFTAGLRWVETAGQALAARGHAYRRYVVGGVPPADEQRHSTSTTDDGRNGIGAYGGLSFIVESGMKDDAPNPQADLGERADAYLTIFWSFITDASHRDEDIRIVEASRHRPIPPFIPVNLFWANVGGKITQYKVIELATGKVVEVPTASFMPDLVVKKSVPTPAAYAISGANAIPAFKALLDRHAITYEVLAAPRQATAEPCTLVRVEEQEDTLYTRLGGRQIVTRGAPTPVELPAGALLVRLDQPAAVRAALLREPTMLYGLFQYKEMRALVGPDNAIPVLRVVKL